MGLVAAGFLPVSMAPWAVPAVWVATTILDGLDRSRFSGSRSLTAHAIEKSTATIVNPSRFATRCEAMFSHDVL